MNTLQKNKQLSLIYFMHFTLERQCSKPLSSAKNFLRNREKFQEICNKTLPDMFPSSVADRIVYFAISMSSSRTVGSPFSALNLFSCLNISCCSLSSSWPV